MAKELEAAGVETRTVKRCEYNDEVVRWNSYLWWWIFYRAQHKSYLLYKISRWADMVVTTGGDGTFLMGSSKILNRSKPVIGINTDPTRLALYVCTLYNYMLHTGLLIVHAQNWRLLSKLIWLGARVTSVYPSTSPSMWRKQFRALWLETSDGSSGSPLC